MPDEIEVSFRCNSCGATLEWQSDHHRDAPVVCEACGAKNATLAELEEAAMKGALESVDKMIGDTLKDWK